MIRNTATEDKSYGWHAGVRHPLYTSCEENIENLKIFWPTSNEERVPGGDRNRIWRFDITLSLACISMKGNPNVLSHMHVVGIR
jgi:hypothetical protein